jgi:SAM-dependent methyltransferase
MSGSAFGPLYASAYDTLHEDKDYERECDLFERMFRDLATGGVRSVLDLGCGTGGHAIPLARRGYSVVGVDRSDGMLARARAKVAAGPATLGLSFHQDDIRTIAIDQVFDAALMPFAVLSYQLSDEDVLSALRAARRHLKAGGLLLFDVWYGPAVLKIGPSERVKIAASGSRTLRRFANGSLDQSRNLCVVGYRLAEMDQDRVTWETTETHVVRYFFPHEIESLLAAAGFHQERLSACPDIDRPADDDSWNVFVAACAT